MHINAALSFHYFSRKDEIITGSIYLNELFIEFGPIIIIIHCN